MGWLNDILLRGAKLRLKELGAESTLPDNPTAADIRREAYLLTQLAKEVQNSKPGGFWSQSHWREISKAIERIEEWRDTDGKLSR